MTSEEAQPCVKTAMKFMLLSSTHCIPLILNAGSHLFEAVRYRRSLHVLQSKGFLPSVNCLLFKCIPEALTCICMFYDVFFINLYNFFLTS